eukprot:365526-Chlamydomonas_euryale.AAC.5
MFFFENGIAFDAVQVVAQPPPSRLQWPDQTGQPARTPPQGPQAIRGKRSERPERRTGKGKVKARKEGGNKAGKGTL